LIDNGPTDIFSCLSPGSLVLRKIRLNLTIKSSNIAQNFLVNFVEVGVLFAAS